MTRSAFATSMHIPVVEDNSDDEDEDDNDSLGLVRMDGHFDFSSLFTRVHVVDDDLFPPHISLDKKPSPFWWVANILTFTSMTPSPQDKSLRYPFWWNGVYTKSLGFPTQDPKILKDKSPYVIKIWYALLFSNWW